MNSIMGRIASGFIMQAFLFVFVLTASGCTIESKTDLHSPYVVATADKYVTYDGWIFQEKNEKGEDGDYLLVSVQVLDTITITSINEKTFKRSEVNGSTTIKHIANIPGINDGYLVGVEKNGTGYSYWPFHLGDDNTLYFVKSSHNVSTISELVTAVNDALAAKKEIMKFIPLNEENKRLVMAKIQAQAKENAQPKQEKTAPAEAR